MSEMYEVDKPKLAKRFVRLFGCDEARITKPGDTMFLVLGWNRRSGGVWAHKGQRYDFDYLEEKCVASGNTDEELIASAREYKRLLELPPDKYLDEWLHKLPQPVSMTHPRLTPARAAKG